MASVYGMAKGVADGFLAKGQAVIDGLLPPEKRAEVIAKLQAFAVANPKLSAFLLSHIALTGLPLLMFIVFTITVFAFSLVAALLIGLLAALLFTAFMVGVALIVVLPIVFMTTMGATFLFLWGLGGYYILKWFNEGESPAQEGHAIGDKINSLTGGRLDFLMDSARTGQSLGSGQGDGVATEKKGQSENAGTVANGGPVNGSTKGTSTATKTANPSKVTNTTAGAQKKAGTTVGTAKGVSSGSTASG